MNYHKHQILLVFISLISTSYLFAANIPIFTILTEEWQPYNFKKDGIVQVTQFERVAASILNMKKLHAGRIDIVPQCKETTIIKCREAGLDPNEFEPVYTLDKKSNYYAFHKDTSDDVISAFQSAFDTLKKEGKLAEIFRKYKK
jgi:ABC-type amino acid transport substrate-binding protein